MRREEIRADLPPKERTLRIRTPRQSPLRAHTASTIAAAAAVLLAAGCSEMQAMQLRIQKMTSSGKPGAPQPLPEGSFALQPLAPVRRDIYTKSYRLGETYTVKVGEPVVSIKNYSITEKVGRATALRDFGQT